MDDIQDRYIDLVAHNYTPQEYDRYSRLIRAHFYAKVWDRDGTAIFTKIWGANFSLAEEVLLAGLATLWEHR